jgi:putative ABC transport system substrate-binding protein
MKQIAPLILGLLVMVGTADAQPPKRLYRIGVLHDAYGPSIPPVEGLKAGLTALGLEEGQDLTFDIRFTHGSVEATFAAAADLVRSGVDLILAVKEQLAHAARVATRTIPIVFVGVGDPVVAGLVSSSVT